MPPASSRGLRSDAPSSIRLSCSRRRSSRACVCHGLRSSATSRSTSTFATHAQSSTRGTSLPGRFENCRRTMGVSGDWGRPGAGGAENRNGTGREPAVARQGRWRSARRAFLLIEGRSRSGLAIGRSRQVTQTSSFSI